MALNSRSFFATLTVPMVENRQLKVKKKHIPAKGVGILTEIKIHGKNVLSLYFTLFHYSLNQ